MNEDKTKWSKRGHINITLINAKRTFLNIDLPGDLTQNELALLNLRLDEIKRLLLESKGDKE